MQLDLETTIQEERTFTQAEFGAFAKLSGDDNPIHVDPEFSARTRFGRTVAHGMFLYSVVCGVISRHFPGAVQLSQSLMFPAPTYADEPMTISVKMLGQSGNEAQLLTEMKNHEGTVTFTGEAVILL
ncbi:MaoC family dehydratase [Candidatus Leptofilum sp.]|uniref:MaoC family dehydratase n=1 Tax=Candidatus Leptofilum sp. TaxID=3241576 RepID=UPI003B5A9847